MPTGLIDSELPSGSELPLAPFIGDQVVCLSHDQACGEGRPNIHGGRR
jgi:hypothetical protein